MSHSELATSYAALILADDDVDITPDKLQTLIKAANVEDVESIWTTLFAKALEGKNVKDMLLNVGSGGGAAAAPTGGAGGAGAADAPAEEAKEEKKEEGKSYRINYPSNAFILLYTDKSAPTEKEESDEDMGFGLFD